LGHQQILQLLLPLSLLLQDLLQPGLLVIHQGSASRHRGVHDTKRSYAARQVPVLRIPEAATPSKVLAAASKAALVSLSHDRLVAAFDRAAAGMDSWQQLAPVIEEPSEEFWERQGEGSGPSSSSGTQQQGQDQQGAVPTSDEQIKDKTFLTGKATCLEAAGAF
jgi:hypothetical protein